MLNNYNHVQINCLVDKHEIITIMSKSIAWLINKVKAILSNNIDVLFSGSFADLVFVLYDSIIKQLLFSDDTTNALHIEINIFYWMFFIA